MSESDIPRCPECGKKHLHACQPDAKKPGKTPGPLSFDDDCILHFAVRYALPRQTAASSIVVRVLLRDWERLLPGTAEQIRGEVQEDLVTRRISREDVPEWLKVPGVQCPHPYTKLEHSASGNESQLVCLCCGMATGPMEHS